MNKTTSILVVVIMALSFVLGATLQGRAQEKSFAGVLPFITSNDRVGFFDQHSGRIYMYDNDISQCVFIGQLQELGQPVQTISSTTLSTQDE